MKRRRGDVAFYALLACAWAVAGGFALWNQGRHAGPRQPAEGASAVSTTVASRHRDPPRNRGAHLRPPSVSTLSIRASRGRSWVTVRAHSSRGRVLYEGILEQGRTLEERGTGFWTEIGAVDNVDVRVDHRILRLGRAALRGVLLAGGGGRGATGSRPPGVVGS